MLAPPFAPLLSLSPSLSLSHTLPSPSRTRAAVRDRRCVRLPVGHTQHQQHKRSSLLQRLSRRNRAERKIKRWRNYCFWLFSSTPLMFFLLIVFHFHADGDLVTVSHLSFLIDLLKSSAPSFADPCVFVRARREWAGTCNLVPLEMRKRRCQRARLQVIAILYEKKSILWWSFRRYFVFHLWQYVSKAEARFFVLRAPFSLQLIDCNPCAATSANLPLTVTYWSVPFGLSPQRSMSLCNWYTRQASKCQDIWFSWRTTNRPHDGGLHVWGERGQLLMNLSAFNVFFFPPQSVVRYCHVVWDIQKRQGEEVAGSQREIHRLLVLDGWCWFEWTGLILFLDHLTDRSMCCFLIQR